MTKLNKILKSASSAMVKSHNARKVIHSTLKAARNAVKKAGGKCNFIIPRSLPVPKKVDGFLRFLVPIFDGFSAASAVAGGAARIAKAVNDANAAKL